MFTSLHALAQQATLMITIAPVGADELRVNVTPMPADTKAKHNLPGPLSLTATPAEFDTDFAAALATWQAPKRSLIQQALDASGVTAPAGPALPAPKPGPAEDKPGRKPARGKKAGGAEPEQIPLQAASDAVGEAAAAVDEIMTGDTTAAGTPDQPRVPGETPLPAAELQVHAEAAGDAGDAAAEQDTVGTVGAEADVYTIDLF